MPRRKIDGPIAPRQILESVYLVASGWEKPAFLCAPGRSGGWEVTTDWRKAHRFPGWDEAKAACDAHVSRQHGAVHGRGGWTPVKASTRVYFSIPAELPDD